MIQPPTTLCCTKCKNDLPLSRFYFEKRRGDYKGVNAGNIEPSRQCKRCRSKIYAVHLEARSVFYSSLWKMLKVGYLQPYEIAYECRRWADSVRDPDFTIIQDMTDEQQEAIVFLEMSKGVETELADVLWKDWIKN